MSSSNSMLRTYSEWVNPYNMDVVAQGMAYKQQRIDATKTQLNQQLQTITNMDLMKDQDREYLYERLNGVVNRLNSVYKYADLSSVDASFALSSELGAAVDSRIVNAYAGTLEYRKFADTMEDLKLNRHDDYSRINELYALAPFNEWVNDGQVGSRLGKLSYTPYFDITKEINNQFLEISRIASNGGTIQIPDPNAPGYMIESQVSGLSSDQIYQIAYSNLSDRAREQASINGWFEANSNPEAYSRPNSMMRLNTQSMDLEKSITALKNKKKEYAGDWINERKIDLNISALQAKKSNVDRMLLDIGDPNNSYSPESIATMFEISNKIEGASQKWAFDNNSLKYSKDAAYWEQRRLQNSLEIARARATSAAATRLKDDVNVNVEKGTFVTVPADTINITRESVLTSFKTHQLSSYNSAKEITRRILDDPNLAELFDGYISNINDDIDNADLNVPLHVRNRIKSMESPEDAIMAVIEYIRPQNIPGFSEDSDLSKLYKNYTEASFEKRKSQNALSAVTDNQYNRMLELYDSEKGYGYVSSRNPLPIVMLNGGLTNTLVNSTLLLPEMERKNLVLLNKLAFSLPAEKYMLVDTGKSRADGYSREFRGHMFNSITSETPKRNPAVYDRYSAEDVSALEMMFKLEGVDFDLSLVFDKEGKVLSPYEGEPYVTTAVRAASQFDKGSYKKNTSDDVDHLKKVGQIDHELDFYQDYEWGRDETDRKLDAEVFDKKSQSTILSNYIVGAGLTRARSFYEDSKSREFTGLANIWMRLSGKDNIDKAKSMTLQPNYDGTTIKSYNVYPSGLTKLAIEVNTQDIESLDLSGSVEDVTPLNVIGNVSIGSITFVNENNVDAQFDMTQDYGLPATMTDAMRSLENSKYAHLLFSQVAQGTQTYNVSSKYGEFFNDLFENAGSIGYDFSYPKGSLEMNPATVSNKDRINVILTDGTGESKREIGQFKVWREDLGGIGVKEMNNIARNHPGAMLYLLSLKMCQDINVGVRHAGTAVDVSQIPSLKNINEFLISLKSQQSSTPAPE